ncbi:ABC transporter ATP-binding protein [Clostridium estertheticum]|uniref:ABC transporter ATP-binding protein/permease n=1 Tax=Clostridium estertheticum TaxID=238834 RepID=UPI0013E900C9|nr:ABC transporter ATP-binding protein [Clostridium estertheticum]MBZ9685665.1 ABC transporter ATP-binding protein [Clostridium estertheticum]
MFEIKNISKKYNDDYALNSVTLEIGKGLNFIIGASGSGKTTLLKIISGMEQEFDGQVSYNNKDIKTLTNSEKSYFYNSVFGFVWQDFNLIEDLTVLENIKLPQYLKDTQNQREIVKIMKDLKISELINQKVKNLSGGQKQRVAIARELVKNPDVIIADEPTSALDEKSSKVTMDILREIAKVKTVIIVTHDTSLIGTNSNVFELDKGELITKHQSEPIKTTKEQASLKCRLSLKNAYSIAITNTKRKIGKFIITASSLLIAATLLLVSVSGTIGDSSTKMFDTLFSTYGDGILDINIVGSFTSAGGTGTGGNKDEPKADVKQNIGGMYNKFLNDDRVSHAVFLQAFSNIKITAEGKEYKIQTSNSVPVVNKLTAGKMPMGSGNEVVVPKSFIEKMNITDKQAIGKTISFKGEVYNWDSGQPIIMPVTTDVTIVGVVDTTVISEYEGKKSEYSVDDSFFFSKSALDKMRAQGNMSGDKINFSIRAKTPADMIAIKDELNAKGIVPLGRFELVEDMVRLNTQTTAQSGSATTLISVLSVILAIAVALITAIMRKREYAIYKVSGFNNKNINLFSFAEFNIAAITAAVLFLVASPLINKGTTAFFHADILNGKLLITGILLVVAMGVVSYLAELIVAVKTNAVTALKTGDR